MLLKYALNKASELRDKDKQEKDDQLEIIQLQKDHLQGRDISKQIQSVLNVINIFKHLDWEGHLRRRYFHRLI